MYYDQLVSDKDAMKDIKMNKRKQAQLLGILFAEYQILTTEQASIVRSQMDKPSHVFEDTSSLWAFYNYVTTALQSSHPKTWMEDQRILHYFISSINNFTKPIPVEVEITHEEEERVADPLMNNYGEPENQTNLLVQIAEAEEASLELEPSISNLDLSTSNLENVPIDEVIQYTDPVGNKFEAPVIDVVNLNKETQMSVVVLPFTTHEAESDAFMDAIDESIDPCVHSLEPTPEDHEQFEKELKEENLFAFDVLLDDDDDDNSPFF